MIKENIVEKNPTTFKNKLMKIKKIKLLAANNKKLDELNKVASVEILVKESIFSSKFDCCTELVCGCYTWGRYFKRRKFQN